MAAGEMLGRIRQALTEYAPRRIEDLTAVPAAVLILVYEREGEVHVLFTERTDQVEHHKGQICFPGGTRDQADNCLKITALRETYEEIGVRPEDVQIVGHLDEIVTVSNFRVTPFVGILDAKQEYPFVLNQREVAQVVQIPLVFLMDERNMELEVREQNGRPILTPAFSYNNHRIWGATARMLYQFIELLR